MPDILKVTTPVTPQGNDGRIRPPAPGETNVLNIPDPARVTQPNAQNVYSERQNGKFLPNYESNYDNFLQLLRGMPDVTQMFTELFFTKTVSLVHAGINENFAAEISKFLEFMNMSESELFTFIKNQLDTSTKFNGPVFNLLRDVLVSTKSEDVKTAVLDMVRKYDNLTSNSHILNEIVSNLKNIARHIPASRTQDLHVMIESLVKNAPNGQNTANLDILKSQVLPFLSSYISDTNDFGHVRDLITMFTLNLARYENGSEEKFVQSFRYAMSLNEVAKKFPGIDLKNLEEMFISNKINMHNPANNLINTNNLIDKLVNIIAKGMTGGAGPQSKAAFENILQSMIVNECVYMPLLHVMIPAVVDNQPFFSEMWIDPDAEESRDSGNGEPAAVKMLIKFDIKNLGYFEMIVLAKGNTVDLQLYYPERFAEAESVIKDGIREIVQRNQLSLQSFSLSKLVVPKAVSEVFPKIYERKSAINVIV